MDKIKKISLLNLFLSMIKIGLFTFGGGYAMIALLENEFVTKKKWLDKTEFLNMTAIAESTPGPIAINAATYIGYKQCKFAGAVIATLGIVLPSFIIIFFISLFFDAFLSVELFAKAFNGIRVAVIYLILSAGIKMLKGSDKDIVSVLILCGTMIFMVVFSLTAVELSSIFYIVIGGILGVVFYFIAALKRKGADKI